MDDSVPLLNELDGDGCETNQIVEAFLTHRPTMQVYFASRLGEIFRMLAK